MHTSARPTLGEYQRAMLDLLKERACAPFSDPHLAEVVHSPGLGLLREVAVWWRGFAVESACPWTAGLLKKLGSFEPSVETFYRSQNVSPYVEKAGEEFLFRMSASTEPLVAAMARLELALMRMRQGSSDESLIEWDRNPDEVFKTLKSAQDLPPAEPDALYRIHVSRDIPGLVGCERHAIE
jgi:hypothetical protein